MTVTITVLFGIFLLTLLVITALAIVKTVIISDQNKMPVDYSLKKKGDQWRVYDVKVEGVSLIKNYRTQFNDILRKEKPEQLIERLNEKVAEQEAALSQG